MVRALQTGSGGVIPHPALDVPVHEEERARSRGIDWVVFGVTAAIAVGFLVWGFLSTPSL
ncbi:MAG: choline/carnitine/betaine transport, partial [Mycobacterium sp.]|nr:choline/carnitine/betaine transport [Mycobacterium sp.]